MDKLICIGKNYLKHALELGDAVPEEPLYFIKPPSTLFEISGGGSSTATTVKWPGRDRGELHHELELVLRLRHDGGDRFSFSHYTFGLDMTLRDLQTRLKKNGQPWEKAKTFLNAAVVGPWRPLASLEKTMALEFTLNVNGKMRQQGRGRDMRWQPTETLRDLPRWFPLRDGDLLFTGTPEGVGPIEDGDQLEITAGDIKYSIQAQRGSSGTP